MEGLDAPRKELVDADNIARDAADKAVREGTEETKKAAEEAAKNATKAKKKLLKLEEDADTASKALEKAAQAVKDTVANDTGAKHGVAPGQPGEEYRFKGDIRYDQIVGVTAQTGFRKTNKIKTDSDEYTKKPHHRGLTDSNETDDPPTAVPSGGGLPHPALNQSDTITPHEE